MPGKSINSRQKRAVESGFLDLLGDNDTNYAPVTLNSIVDTLIYLAALYVSTATNKLNEKDKVSSGFLSDSIKATPVQILGKVYQVEINLAKYYQYVDQGVSGWNNSYPTKFKFQHFTGKSGKKSSAMVTAIRKWIIQEGLQAKAVNGKKTIFSRERKQSAITDTSTRTAIIISRAIRKHGLKPTHFWLETQKEVEQVVKDEFTEAIKIDIITNLYGNSNK